MSELQEYNGGIHVHTAYSDSSGRMPYVIECARKAGLDYVIIGDHNTLRARDEGWEGYHDGVLVVVGVEVSSSKGHTLALGLGRCPRRVPAHPDEYLPEIARAGGIAFIAHPEQNGRTTLRWSRQDWPDLKTDCYAGIEIWSYMHDWFEWAKPWHPIAGIRNPEAGITGPVPEVLRAWDEIALRRHISGIGALDAHELRLPIHQLKWSLLKILPLEYTLTTIHTHALMRPMSGDAAADIAALTDALAAGRCFTAYDFIGDATGTRFAARRGQETALMGDEIQAGGELEFTASVPREADIALLRNSEVVAKVSACQLTHRDARPGVYRVEARLDGQPWVYTNHIYVRCPSQSQP